MERFLAQPVDSRDLQSGSRQEVRAGSLVGRHHLRDCLSVLAPPAATPRPASTIAAGVCSILCGPHVGARVDCGWNTHSRQQVWATAAQVRWLRRPWTWRPGPGPLIKQNQSCQVACSPAREIASDVAHWLNCSILRPARSSVAKHKMGRTGLASAGRSHSINQIRLKNVTNTPQVGICWRWGAACSTDRLGAVLKCSSSPRMMEISA